ncbi:DUF2264 domain-containing protein [Echinicola jeungdonensis]|uniref:DUF2264 domain-containing protein n=1 Tax=Echinicola jeungdonensis TaxID=709343 RepID=A0ABV5J376_9BACT|nr:DUF2264 domain-containing protein [Echinicola jeungdonensis]MDN3668481.1 DUF2264 domain-containing protein [Echinicola jeungdonensis]
MKQLQSSLMTICLFLVSLGSYAQSGNAPYVVEEGGKKIFKVAGPDYELSPHTGMTKKHWKDAALYLLEGAFSYINNLDDPMKFPKQPGKSYPHDEGRVPTEKLEGLCRTLFVATPLLKENPDLEINGISVAEYYQYQISKLVDRSSPAYIHPRAKNGGPSQNLVEFGALGISLMLAPNVLWEPLSQENKDALAATMISYGDGPTVPSNWKFFNIFVLSFFKDQGYEINEALLEEYLQKSLAHYRGDGWYNDNPAFDYYSMWAFQMYGMIWSEYFGNEYYPEYAAQFKENFNDLKDNYPYLFSQDGKMIMWGRSISYRMGSIVPLPLMGFEEDKDLNYGWMRRIASGTMLQFLQHPDFLKDNVPTLGFYGPFEPAVQGYSCRGSVFWMGKAFLGLMVPDDSPFWTSTENEGPWENKFEDDKIYNHFQQGSDILITNYPGIGASEIRAWCHVAIIPAWEKFRGSENYNRLSYNSAFPWQEDGKNGEVAMNYVFKNEKAEWEALRLFTFKKYNRGIYYRDVKLETNEDVQMDLAEIPLPNGILRVDRNRSKDSIAMRLGHYALPDLGEGIEERVKKVKGYEIQIIDNGEYQLAMVPLKGWSGIEVVEATGLHPQSDKSAVINVFDDFDPETEHISIYATLMLWKKSGEKWSEKELMPIQELEFNKEDKAVKLTFKNGGTKTVYY